MEEKKSRRCLRNSTNCTPYENIFKENNRIENSASIYAPS